MVIHCYYHFSFLLEVWHLEKVQRGGKKKTKQNKQTSKKKKKKEEKRERNKEKEEKEEISWNLKMKHEYHTYSSRIRK